ncbi:short chain dehydrogenase [Legionella israelensis]|uniref:Short chain dehydrogenase n=1 Tax=Legionella israelensis TaxID=454 RepID=A0A0W0WGE7_9GAMM|nr:short chain dehydrogenase [Legionella israelensis]KTD31360.1 short chain dehydrogenase [Legionella israelensis]QBS09844.1 short chain dehydrogenase [Legionella israelensis]SCY13905.1 NAD(P)-dependent dehydrogenase, short-chain alcohol dehydrogenase family [Legionella israelensis DSM 19235]STX59403.1 short chain dehydrogenase [Legionella israelensis]
MKVIIIGGTGTIGQAVAAELKGRHEIILAGHHSGDIRVDISDKNSIEKMYKKIKDIDAVVMTVGKVHFASFEDMHQEHYEIGLKNKLMGQVNVVLQGRHILKQHGSFTLTSGILNIDPIRYGSSAAMVNGAIDGFVKSAALEMPNALRINSVSPTVIKESMENYAAYFRGYKPVTAAEAALAYSKSVEGLQTGQIYKVGY